MKKDNVLETKYLERPRGEGKGWVFRMPTPRLLVGWINAKTGRPYGKTIREGLRAFPGEIYAAPAHSPAQPPQGYRPYRVVGRGSGWFDFFRKCSSTRAVAVARKRRDLRLGEIRAEEGKLEAEKAGDIELAAKNHDALRRVRHPAVKQAMQEDIEKYARDKVLPVAGMAKAKLWRNVARDGHVPLSLIYETYLEDAGKDLARTTVNNLKTAWNDLLAFFPKEVAIQEIDRQAVFRFVNEYLPSCKTARTPDGPSPATIKKKLSLLSSLWKWAMEKGFIDMEPMTPWDRQGLEMKAVRAASKKRRGYRPDEARRLLEAAPPGKPLGDMIRIALSTGVSWRNWQASMFRMWIMAALGSQSCRAKPIMQPAMFPYSELLKRL